MTTVVDPERFAWTEEEIERLPRVQASVSRFARRAYTFDEAAHPRGEGGRFTTKDDGDEPEREREDTHGATTEGVKAAAASWRDGDRGDYVTDEGLSERDLDLTNSADVKMIADSYWGNSFSQCDDVQAAADAYVGRDAGPYSGFAAFIAERYVEAMRDGESSGSTPLYRGLAGADVADSFVVGERVGWSIGSFSEDQYLAASYTSLTNDDAGVVLQTTGDWKGANAAMRETLVGGEFEVVAKESGVDIGAGRTGTLVTIRQVAGP